MQGKEAKIVIFDITPAHEQYGSMVGFLREDNRVNVALTRARDALFCVGNLDCWRGDLQQLMERSKATSMGYLIMDLIYFGDICDAHLSDRLPAEDGECRKQSDEWSKSLDHEPKLSHDPTSQATKYNKKSKNQRTYERGIINKLNKMPEEAYKRQEDL